MSQEKLLRPGINTLDRHWRRKTALAITAAVLSSGAVTFGAPYYYAEPAPDPAPKESIKNTDEKGLADEVYTIQQTKKNARLTPDAPSGVKASTSISDAKSKLDKVSGYRNVTISWNPVKGAEEYVVYASAQSDYGFKPIIITKGTSITKEVYKGMRLYYKVQTVQGGAVSALSDWAAVTSGEKPNEEVTVAKAKDKVTEDSSTQVKAKGNGSIRYESRNPDVANIDTRGKVKAKNPGKTEIYAKTDSGKAGKVPLTVKPRMIKMPKFTGLTQEKAGSLAEEKKIRITISSAYVTHSELASYGSDIAYGEIGTQSVEAGKSVRQKGASVSLVMLRPDLADPETREAITQSGQGGGSGYLLYSYSDMNTPEKVPVSRLGGAFAWPAPGNYVITSTFGHRSSPGGIGSTYHQGMDIGANTGNVVTAAKAGTVIHAGAYGGYGNCVIIRHERGIETLYGHLSAVTCQPGKKVDAGTVIGKAGSTGISTGPHLHFGVSVNGVFVDPKPFLFSSK